MATYYDEWIYCDDDLPESGTHVFAAVRSLKSDREPWVVDVFYAEFGGKRHWGYGIYSIPLIESGEAEVYAWKHKHFPEPPVIRQE